AAGELPVQEALRRLGAASEENLGFARVDLERHHRRGFPEVIFSSGKTPEQIIPSMRALQRAGQNILCTRATREMYDAIAQAYPGAVYHAEARLITLDVTERPKQTGQIAVVSAGTSDIPVAEEAAITAEWMGARVVRVYDVGVAGLHRLVNHLDTLRASRAVVVVAGMEGALPSVVGGLIARPIIAVPTSVGYGTHLQGLAPLLAMLNTCVPGIAVVNVDNGFGAGVTAALINRTEATE
ncbi:MAG: 1-(5-phosphoribosyl)-5-amino-4-imidazole-carboxylate carboxylase, partial [Verrucomicrobia bacterium A1]